jgi:ABC-type branched-subunit amino acid transport system substrate-binding protein
VDDTSITLGMLVDPALDRGFTQGFDLWRRSVNHAGGECGRSVQVVSAGVDGVPASLPEAYLATARDVLGYVTLTGSGDAEALARYAGGDGVPAVTTSGLSSQLASPGPVIIGPTDDIMAINAFSYLQQQKSVGDGPVGVLSDGSAAATDWLVGLRWAADAAHVTLEVRTAASASAPWSDPRAVFSLASPADTVALLAALPSTVPVMTTITGYDEAAIAANPAAAAAVAARRLLVTTATPALGSNHPAAVALAGAFSAAGGTNPGPRLLEGYAAGAGWGRLLDAACTASALTRAGVMTAMTTVGPAPIDSMLGPTDPSLVINAHQPATRLSAIAAVDPSAPTGLAPVTWLQAAKNIGDYHPTP